MTPGTGKARQKEAPRRVDQRLRMLLHKRIPVRTDVRIDIPPAEITAPDGVTLPSPLTVTETNSYTQTSGPVQLMDSISFCLSAPSSLLLTFRVVLRAHDALCAPDLDATDWPEPGGNCTVRAGDHFTDHPIQAWSSIISFMIQRMLLYVKPLQNDSLNRMITGTMVEVIQSLTSLYPRSDMPSGVRCNMVYVHQEWKFGNYK